MSKEQLEEIKYYLNSTFTDDNYEIVLCEDIGFPRSQLEWLIKFAEEQLKRVQELEEENKRVRQMKYHEAYEQGKFDTNMKVWYEMPILEQENKRYREALEFIDEELELVLHSNRGLAEKMFYIENSKRKITEVLESESE